MTEQEFLKLTRKIFKQELSSVKKIFIKNKMDITNHDEQMARFLMKIKRSFARKEGIYIIIKDKIESDLKKQIKDIGFDKNDIDRLGCQVIIRNIAHEGIKQTIMRYRVLGDTRVTNF